jgi:hypothetical protein
MKATVKKLKTEKGIEFWGIIKFPGMTYKIGPYPTKQQALHEAQRSLKNAAY